MSDDALFPPGDSYTSINIPPYAILIYYATGEFVAEVSMYDDPDVLDMKDDFRSLKDAKNWALGVVCERALNTAIAAAR